MKVIETIKAALAKAEFQSGDVETALDLVLNSHKSDLGDVGYEPSTDTEDAIKELNAALDRADQEVENRRADLKEAGKLAREEEE